MLKKLTQIYCLIICLVATVKLGVAFNIVTEIALTQYNSEKKNEWK